MKDIVKKIVEIMDNVKNGVLIEESFQKIYYIIDEQIDDKHLGALIKNMFEVDKHKIDKGLDNVFNSSCFLLINTLMTHDFEKNRK